MNDLSSSTAVAAVSASFLASLVEFVEVFTIILAVGLVEGWRPALTGSAVGLVLLIAVVALLGPLLGHVPLHLLQLTTGTLLLLFGARWLRKAILRAAGRMPLHDEQAAFAEESARLRLPSTGGPMRVSAGAIAAFKGVILEGGEVVFIVIAVGASQGLIYAASVGALAAAILVLAIGLMLHRPLTQVPENTLKFAIGIVLSAFGVFWLGEGLGFVWPGESVAILVIASLLLAASLVSMRILRRSRRT
jgi:uncharacterized membrane protein